MARRSKRRQLEHVDCAEELMTGRYTFSGNTTKKLALGRKGESETNENMKKKKT